MPTTLTNTTNSKQTLKLNFETFRQDITTEIQQLLTEWQKQNASQAFATDVVKRLKNFNIQGKMNRGSILMALALNFNQASKSRQSKKINYQNALLAAAALELFQAAMLIHDDIIDQDRLRRGQPSMYVQYENWAKNHTTTPKPEHIGQGLALCLGDINILLSFDLLAQLQTTATIKTQITRLFTHELSTLCLAEMHDVWLSISKKTTTETEITQMYIYKTGRYSFSLPMMVGAVLAKQNPEEIQKLSELGEILGLIFQIKDDGLNLFGSEDQIGKSVGSDIKEGKKTFYLHKLLLKVNKTQNQLISQIIGNSQATKTQIQQVIQLIKDLKIEQEIDAFIKKKADLAIKTIMELKAPSAIKNLLKEFCQYNIQRKY